MRRETLLTFLQLDKQRKSKYSGLFSWRERSLYWSSIVHLLWKRPIIFGMIIFLVMGCEGASKPRSQENKISKEIESEIFEPFWVYNDKGSRENHFVPSGFMPNGNCVKMNDAWQEKCREGRACIKIIYDIACSEEDQEWAGIYWLNPANNWGSRKGGFNLKGATKLTFWAKGKSGGERIEEFNIGGITGDYPDTDTAMIGPVVLTNDWRKYTIDLRGKDLSYISGGFSWTTSVKVNSEECVFFLDSIRYE